MSRAAVAASWRRCRERGLSPHAGVPPAGGGWTPWDVSDVPATPAAPAAGELLVTLCDARGVVRGLCGPAALVTQAGATGLAPGADLAEAVAGTNAVALAMAEQRRVAVRGGDHFLAALQGWAAAAAPVHWRGRVAGYAAVWWPAAAAPGPRSVRHRLDLAAAALREQASRHEADWLLAMLAEAEGPLRAHLLAAADGSVLLATPTAARLLGCERVADLGLTLPFLFRQVRRCLAAGAPQQSIMRPPAVPNACRVTVSPLDGAAEVAAVAITLLQATGGRGTDRGAAARYEFADIITAAPAMERALAVARSAAATDVPVLLLGESGTGKELVAQAIHRSSPRAGGPFVAVNCAAFPRDLIVSELFGYEEGAFTGAARRGAPGRFEQAHGGTLFLDEIGEMAPEHQALLLRVLEDGRVVRLGGGAPRQVDVRIVAATNRDLRGAVEQGAFRADLYYRLNIMPVHLPPLRERPEDIPLLASRFLEREGRALGRRLSWAPEALRRLRGHSWPGNVRELYNIVKRAAILADDGIAGPAVLPWLDEAGATSPPGGAGALPGGLLPGGMLPGGARHRRRLRPGEVAAALHRAGGNVSAAARQLGVARSTIYRIQQRAAARGGA